MNVNKLLHGRRVFGDATAGLAHDLLTTFYRDHEMFYKYQQNYVLHLHIHYAEIYQNHGSLCNINTFSQEDIMGAVSKCKHGSRYWGDQLAFYLNIDFALKNSQQYEESAYSIFGSEGVFDETTLPVELIQVISSVHTSLCHCHDLNQCIKFYRRFRNKKQIVYHSLAYTKRQSSVSYFVKYNSLFGIIITFMSCDDKQYAIIKRHAVKKKFSDYFVSSPYHSLLSKPIDTFFFVLEKQSLQFDVVDVYSSLDMCIVIEEDDCFIVSPLSIYHEHD
ncbi:unnamed protein product [Rotaria sp. Silwood2]|nr:unnamed protein product [Rotaria sp. Silwood2]